MMTRRGFLGRVSAGAASALLPSRILVALLPAIPILYGDGKHDDTAALQAWGRGEVVHRPDGEPVGQTIQDGYFVVSDTIAITRNDGVRLISNYFDCKMSTTKPPTFGSQSRGLAAFNVSTGLEA